MVIDYEAELEVYIDMFDKAKIRGNKLICCSPFRNETHPSFAVNLDNGTYIDSGETDEYLRKGNFVKLLAFLMETDYSIAEKYLIYKYDLLYVDLSSLNLELDLNLTLQKRLELTPPEYLESLYLNNRGIQGHIQRKFSTSDNGNTVAFPIYNEKGKLVNIKYRSTVNKTFWYADGGLPVKQYLYGLDKVKQLGSGTVFVTEGEIDALYLWTVGSPAVATFGASASERQIQLLRSGGFKEVVLATDNDRVGRAFNKYLAGRLMDITKVSYLKLPREVKDVNELSPNTLIKTVYDRRLLLPKFLS